MKKNTMGVKQDYFKLRGGQLTEVDNGRFNVVTKQEKDRHFFKVPVLRNIELARDYRFGAYKDIATWAIAAIVLGLLYLINPVELVPDVIPVIGYLDDVAVLALILKLVKAELEQYAAWRKARAEDENTVSRLSDRD